METKGKFPDEVEMEGLLDTLSAHHNKFGSSLLQRWGFSDQCVQVARYCDEIKAADPISKELIIVHFANLLVGTMGYDFEDPEKIDLESAESTHLLGLESSIISEIKNKVKEYMEGELIECFS